MKVAKSLFKYKKHKLSATDGSRHLWLSSQLVLEMGFDKVHREASEEEHGSMKQLDLVGAPSMRITTNTERITNQVFTASIATISLQWFCDFVFR